MASEVDFALLDAWRAGDDRAGNELFERHFDSIHRFFDRKVSTVSDLEGLAKSLRDVVGVE